MKHVNSRHNLRENYILHFKIRRHMKAMHKALPQMQPKFKKR